MPEGSVEAYKAVAYWSEFSNIVGTVTSIENTEIRSEESTIIYDLTGRPMTDTKHLKSGIYIVDGKKMLVKD